MTWSMGENRSARLSGGAEAEGVACQLGGGALPRSAAESSRERGIFGESDGDQAGGGRGMHYAHRPSDALSPTLRSGSDPSPGRPRLALLVVTCGGADRR